jgi:hypothetical protein
MVEILVSLAIRSTTSGRSEQRSFRTFIVFTMKYRRSIAVDARDHGASLAHLQCLFLQPQERCFCRGMGSNSVRRWLAAMHNFNRPGLTSRQKLSFIPKLSALMICFCYLWNHSRFVFSSSARPEAVDTFALPASSLRAFHWITVPSLRFQFSPPLCLVTP